MFSSPTGTAEGTMRPWELLSWKLHSLSCTPNFTKGATSCFEPHIMLPYPPQNLRGLKNECFWHIIPTRNLFISRRFSHPTPYSYGMQAWSWVTLAQCKHSPKVEWLPYMGEIPVPSLTFTSQQTGFNSSGCLPSPPPPPFWSHYTLILSKSGD